MNLVQYRIGAILTWCNRGAYRIGANEHNFCMNSEIFFANVLDFFTRILFDK